VKIPLVAAALGAWALGTPLAAQEGRFFLEGRGGAVVPTFDIADVAKTGASFGATVGYRVSPRLALLGEFDYGMHKDKPTSSTDIKTLHFMGKVGYAILSPAERGWEVMVNLGAGAVGFDVDGAPKTYTYFAINAGAKILYHVNPSLAFLLSPQGDIAFSKEDDLTTNNAWVWPFTAGVRVTF